MLIKVHPTTTENMDIFNIKKLSDVTQPILESHAHMRADNGLIVSLIAGEVEMLGAGQWLVPVRQFPEYGQRMGSFYDFIPHGYEEWAESHYPYLVEEYGVFL